MSLQQQNSLADLRQTEPVTGNANGTNVQLIKAMCCAGLYPNVIVAPRELVPNKSSSSKGMLDAYLYLVSVLHAVTSVPMCTA
jgi:hypothetical protein